MRAWYTQTSEEGVGSLGSEFTCGCWELSLSLLGEQLVLLTAESSLQLLFYILCCVKVA